MPRLLIIIGSTRPGRIGLPVARWFEARARRHGGFEIELVDLAELALPLLDEPAHPRLGQYANRHTLDWSAIVDRADAVVLVTSEYNYGYPAPLKNALDFLHAEWRHKAIGFVSYGGVAAGTRAVQQLKQVIGALQMFPVATAVSIPFVGQLRREESIEANDTMNEAATAMLDELVVLDQALRALRD